MCFVGKTQRDSKSVYGRPLGAMWGLKHGLGLSFIGLRANIIRVSYLVNKISMSMS